MSLRFRRAITRRPAASYVRGLSSGDPGPGDIALFARQHGAYVEALRRAGLRVDVLEPIETLPDAHFVEDVAVILPEIVVLTRPGAAARRDEVRHIEPALASLGEPARIEPPGTLDGGDVLFMGRHCLIGRSRRSNASGVRQLRRLLEPHGYRCESIRVATGLHLKSSVSAIGEDTVAITEELAEHSAFRQWRRLVVPPAEVYAANSLRINGCLLVPQDCPETLEQLAALNMKCEIIPLDLSEARRMDGGLSCMSLRF